MRKFLLLILYSIYLLPFSTSALQLRDGESFVYDMGENGALMSGSLNAYSNMYQLRVNSANYIGTIRDMISEREIRTTIFTESASGLEISRRLYVSKTLNFARYMETLYNPTDVDRVVDVEISGNLSERSEIFAVTNQAQFLITDDRVKKSPDSVFDETNTDSTESAESNSEKSGSAPILLHYHSQVGNAMQATHNLNGNTLSWTYSQVAVPAHSTARIVYFIAQTKDIEAANAIATLIFNNSSVLYEGLSPIAQSQLVNFIPPLPSATTDFSSAPFLNLSEVRTGNLSDSDSFSHIRANTKADFYALRLETGQQVAIAMSAYFNTYLYVFKDIKGNELVASNDDGEGNSTQARILLTATEPQTYYIEATAYDSNARGKYTLQITRNPNNFPPTAYPFNVTPESLTVPATVTFTDFSQDSDGEIVERCWQFGDGSPMDCVEENVISHTFEKAGHFTVSVVLKDEQGALAYRSQLVSVRSNTEGVVLPLASSISRELPSADETLSFIRSNAFAERYRIDAVSAGKTVLIDMVSENVNSFLYLYDSFNRRLRQNDDGIIGNHAHLRYTPTDNEDLLIETTTFADKTEGIYTLTLKEVDETDSLTIGIEKRPENDNSLKNLIIARLPADFNASFLRWNFGDGSAVVNTDKTAIYHTFPQVGDFTIDVTAVDDSGRQAQGSAIVSIGDVESAIQARFSTQPLFGENPLRVFFVNESVADDVDEELTYLWDFGDGTLSTLKNPTHHYTQAGTYPIVLKVYSPSKQQRASFSQFITVIDRTSPYIPVVGKARIRPQVIIAGIDPILLDVMDTDMRIFAIIRAGQTPIQTVRLIQNDSDFFMVMQHVSTYANGDQRFESVYTFPKGMFSIATLGDLFGQKAGQFKIEVTAQDGHLHSFPNVEMAENTSLNQQPSVLYTPPTQYAGIRRNPPQVLGAGFDPALVDLATDTQLTLKAIVREGASPIQNVVFQQNDGSLSIPMQQSEVLPNGDKLYVAQYPFPQGSFESHTLDELFGTKPAQFMIIATDQAQQSHRFPELKIGNFPEL